MPTARRKLDFIRMAAAPRLVDRVSPVASPELALVDPGLAEELRRSLSPAEHTWLRPRSDVEEYPDATEVEAPQLVSTDEPRVPATRDAEHPDHEEYVVAWAVEPTSPQSRQGEAEHVVDDESIVDLVEPIAAQSRPSNSHYPILPAPEPEAEATNETEAALQRIRERMTEELPASRRKLRRRFTVASGATALCAVGVVAVDVQLQVAQLPGWLHF